MRLSLIGRGTARRFLWKPGRLGRVKASACRWPSNRTAAAQTPGRMRRMWTKGRVRCSVRRTGAPAGSCLLHVRQYSYLNGHQSSMFWSPAADMLVLQPVVQISESSTCAWRKCREWQRVATRRRPAASWLKVLRNGKWSLAREETSLLLEQARTAEEPRAAEGKASAERGACAKPGALAAAPEAGEIGAGGARRAARETAEPAGRAWSAAAAAAAAGQRSWLRTEGAYLPEVLTLTTGSTNVDRQAVCSLSSEELIRGPIPEFRKDCTVDLSSFNHVLALTLGSSPSFFPPAGQ